MFRSFPKPRSRGCGHRDSCGPDFAPCGKETYRSVDEHAQFGAEESFFGKAGSESGSAQSATALVSASPANNSSNSVFLQYLRRKFHPAGSE